jgi:hypothetical protein
MPESEHESAAAAWLDNGDTQREISVLRDRFPDWTEYERTSFALLMELVVALNFYGGKPISMIELVEEEDDDPPEPWRGN